MAAQVGNWGNAPGNSPNGERRHTPQERGEGARGAR